MRLPIETLLRRLLFGVIGLIALATGCASLRSDWRTASHEPIGTAPDPATVREAIVQVYSARTFGWRGLFGVHTWVATKPANASNYTVYEVIGWRARWNDSVVAIHTRAPDARWYGSSPELLADKRGEAAEALIPRIQAAVSSYPWKGEYTVWPGPNSNTFTAWITRAVPELQVDLPPTAIGKDYNQSVFGSAPSGGGGQASVAGLLAVTVSGVEGLELNVLGLTFGLNPFDPAVKLPLVGRIGPERNLAN